MGGYFSETKDKANVVTGDVQSLVGFAVIAKCIERFSLR